MIEIKFETPVEEICKCCGNTTIRLTRFVYQDNSAFAVYYAQFTKAHDEKVLSGLIGLGVWGDDNIGPEARVAFPFQIRMNNGNFQVGLVNAKESPWSHVTFMGKILDREEALRHSYLQDVFHITDHMVVDDEVIVNYFTEKNI